MQDALLDEDKKRQEASTALKIDYKALLRDEEGIMLIEQAKELQNEHKQFIDNKRKQHEQVVRE